MMEEASKKPSDRKLNIAAPECRDVVAAASWVLRAFGFLRLQKPADFSFLAIHTIYWELESAFQHKTINENIYNVIKVQLPQKLGFDWLANPSQYLQGVTSWI